MKFLEPITDLKVEKLLEYLDTKRGQDEYIDELINRFLVEVRDQKFSDNEELAYKAGRLLGDIKVYQNRSLTNQQNWDAGFAEVEEILK